MISYKVTTQSDEPNTNVESGALVYAAMKALDETTYQRTRWGHNRINDPFKWIAILTEEVGESAEAALNLHRADHDVEDNDPEEELEKELIQVAAVALSAIASLKRFGNTFESPTAKS